MTNSNYPHTTLGERGPSEMRRGCSLLEPRVTGNMGHTAKENGGRQTVKAGKATILKRPLQDRSEAPRRKRVHVCGGNFGVIEGRMGTAIGAEDSTLGAGFGPTINTPSQGIHADDGEEGFEKASTEFQLDSIVDGENGIMDEDVEMTEVADESGEQEPAGCCLPREPGRPIEATGDDLRARSCQPREPGRPIEAAGDDLKAGCCLPREPGRPMEATGDDVRARSCLPGEPGRPMEATGDDLRARSCLPREPGRPIEATGDYLRARSCLPREPGRPIETAGDDLRAECCPPREPGRPMEATGGDIRARSCLPREPGRPMEGTGDDLRARSCLPREPGRPIEATGYDLRARSCLPREPGRPIEAAGDDLRAGCCPPREPGRPIEATGDDLRGGCCLPREPGRPIEATGDDFRALCCLPREPGRPIEAKGGDVVAGACLPREPGRTIEARGNDFRASEVEDEDSLGGVNPREMQVPGSASESAWQDGNSQQWWEGMASGVFPCRETHSREDSAQVLPSGVPGGIREIPMERRGRVEQMYELLASQGGRGHEMHHDIGEGCFETRDDSRVNEEDLSNHVELSSEDEPISRNGYPPEDVEVIEVDDSDDDPIEMNAYESDGSSTKGTKPIIRPSVTRNGVRRTISRSTSASYSPDEESDSDDCQVVGEWKPNLNPRQPQRNKADSDGQDDDSDTEEDRSEESESSDVQVAGGPHSDIQRGWEEAALRRRMGRAMKSAGSKVNGEHEATADLDLTEGARSEGLAESVATSAYRDSPDSTAESSEVRGGAEGFIIPRDGHAGANPAPPSEGSLLQPKNKNQEINPPGIEAKEMGIPGLHIVNGGENQSGMSSKELNGHESHREDRLSSIDVRIPTASEPRQKVAGAGDSLDKGDLIALRERLKQTPEFLEADEQEWAARQQELLRQQLEAQKMRQRKRLEADRKLEMERKQKLRILELRQSQIKAEKEMDEKEQLRGQVREKLEYLAAKCSDLASLLRRLGINVDGGYSPSEQQVNAAFKRALVKFHPDRVVDGDARRLVESEETFKLINRMKKTLDGYDPFR